MPTPDDLEALRELSDRYASGADRRDSALYVSAFLPTGRLYIHRPADAPALSQRHGHESLAKVTGLLGERYDLTFHFLGNRFYEVAPDAQTATGDVYCIAHHITHATSTDHVMHIRYEDQYARNDAGEWRIEERRFRLLFTETRPIDAPS